MLNRGQQLTKLGIEEFKRGNLEKAESLFRESLVFSPTLTSYVNLGQILRDRGDIKRRHRDSFSRGAAESGPRRRQVENGMYTDGTGGA